MKTFHVQQKLLLLGEKTQPLSVFVEDYLGPNYSLSRSVQCSS